jgi:hypothetical protein
MENKTSKEYCKYLFSAEELAKISSEMAQQVEEKKHLDDDLKAIKDDFKAKISKAEAAINSCALKVNNGYEMRNIECIVDKDYEKKVVRYIRLDTGEVVRTRLMEQADFELNLPGIE